MIEQPVPGASRGKLYLFASMASAPRSETVKAKVVLLGEGAVGKTSLVLRYVENKFNDKHESTLQVNPTVRTV